MGIRTLYGTRTFILLASHVCKTITVVKQKKLEFSITPTLNFVSVYQNYCQYQKDYKVRCFL